jgi:hypothetical protein
MPSRPSDEEKTQRRTGVLPLACDALLRDVRRANSDGGRHLGAPRRFRRSLIEGAGSSTA